MSKPFLQDGRKFSLAVYVIVTSIVPLRVYILDTKHIVRLCTKPYDPDDLSDPKSHITDGVIMDDDRAFWWEAEKGEDQVSINKSFK